MPDSFRHHIRLRIFKNGVPLEEYEDAYFERTNPYIERPDDALWETDIRQDPRSIYANPDGQDEDISGRRPTRVAASKFVEAIAGDKYTLKVYVGPKCPFKKATIYFRVNVDGLWVEGFQANYKKRPKTKGWTQLLLKRRNHQTKKEEDFMFSANEFTDVDDGEDETGAKEKNMGIIRLLCYRVIALPPTRKGQKGLGQSAVGNSKKLQERHIKKGDFPALGTIYANPTSFYQSPRAPKYFLDEPKPASIHEYPPEESLGYWFADLRIKYRPRLYLQGRDLIPYDPVPHETDYDRRQIKRALALTDKSASDAEVRDQPQNQTDITEANRDNDDDVQWLRTERDETRPGNYFGPPIDVDAIIGNGADLPIVITDDDVDGIVVQSVEDRRLTFVETNRELLHAVRRRNLANRKENGSPRRGLAFHVPHNSRGMMASESPENELFVSQDTELDRRHGRTPAEAQRQALRNARSQARSLPSDEDAHASAAVRERQEVRIMQSRSLQTRKAQASSSSRLPPKHKDRVYNDRSAQRQFYGHRPPPTPPDSSPQTPPRPQSFRDVNKEEIQENAKKRKAIDLPDDEDIYELDSMDET